MQLFIDVIGWVGVVFLLGAYALVSMRRLAGDSVLYQVLNLAGAVMLMANSFYYRAMPSVFVNIVWSGIAIYTVIQARRRNGVN